MKHLAIGLLATTLAAGPATASVADYCAAYARDKADMATASVTSDVAPDAFWQQRHDEFTRSCTARFAPETSPAPRKLVKPVVVAAVKKAPVRPAEKVVLKAPKPTADDPPEKLVKLPPALTPGSPAWTDYCKKKYVSFNIATGTYTSLTGVERKCLVTAD